MNNKGLVWQLNKRLFRLNPARYLLYFLLSLLWSASPFICAYLVKALFDTLEANQGIIFNFLCAALLSVNLLSVYAVRKTGVLEIIIRFTVGKVIKDRVMDAMIESKTKSKGEIGRFLDIMNYDVDALEYMLLTQLDLISQLLYVVIALLSLLAIHSILTLYVVLPIISISILFWWLSKKYQNHYASAREGSIDYSNTLSEFMLNRESIQFMGNTHDIERAFKQTCQHRGHSRLRRMMFGFLFESLTQSISAFGVAALLFTSVMLKGENTIQVGDLTLFVAFISYGCTFLDLFAVTASGIRGGEDSLVRLSEFIEQSPERSIMNITKPIGESNSKAVHRMINSVYFTNFKIAFDDQPHTFCLNEGEILVVTGPNASGKTKFLDAVLGYAPYFGKIDIAGEDSCPMGYVPQKSTLFDASIDENVGLFNEEVSKLQDALCIANVEDHFCKGNETIGVDGKNLSEGQRQRVSLARAYYHSHGLLLLDDAFAYLDKTNRTGIYNNIIAKGQTLIIASNDPDILSKANLWVELNDQRMTVRTGAVNHSATKNV